MVPLHEHQLQEVVSDLLSPSEDDARPVLLFLAGCNGSGKTSFFLHVVDQPQGSRRFIFVNADLIASIVGGLPARDVAAQAIAEVLRRHMVQQRASFATETVFSDEVGAKLQFLRDAEAAGFHVVLVYVTLASVHLSRARVAFRVAQGGHDVPEDRLVRRFVASRENCRRALNFVETGIVLDNSVADRPLRLMAITRRGAIRFEHPRLPAFVRELLPIAPAYLPEEKVQPIRDAGAD